MLTLVAVLLLAASPLLARSAPTGATFKAVFTAEYTMQFKTPAGKSGTAKSAPQPTQAQTLTIPGDGEILWDEPNLRVDFSNGLNQEAMRLIVDFDSGKAAMLYPDTLNGYRTDLKALDTKGYLPIARDFLSRRKDDVTPPGFTKKTLGSEKIGGASATHVKYTKTDGTQVDVWRNKSGDPLRISAKTSKGKLKLDFTSFKRGAKVDAKSFHIDKSFELEDVKQPPSEFGG